MIRKVGSNYNVYTKDGSRKLGSHSSLSGAKSQLAAIEISKKKRKKKKKRKTKRNERRKAKK